MNARDLDLLAASGLDPIRRMHVLAAGLRGAGIVQGVLDAPFEHVWAAATDFEGGSIPVIEVLIGATRVVGRDTLAGAGGERVDVRFRPRPLGPEQRLDVILRPGWCVMQSRLAIAGMAAVAEDDGRTRFAHLEAFRLPFGGARMARLIEWKMRATHELESIEGLAHERGRREMTDSTTPRAG